LVLTERLSLENTTVHDVVAMGRYPYTSFLGGLTPEDESIIAEALQQVGFHLSPFNFHLSFFNNHSDGEKQRILIAKALAQQTPIILLDEPTAHLDLPHRILILRLLRNLAHEQGKTILISTHELDLALALSDRILLMTPGKGIQLDTADNLRKTDAFTSAFGMDIFNPLAG
jgi:iron complex transport system ATP-binding protein